MAWPEPLTAAILTARALVAPAMWRQDSATFRSYLSWRFTCICVRQWMLSERVLVSKPRSHQPKQAQSQSNATSAATMRRTSRTCVRWRDSSTSSTACARKRACRCACSMKPKQRQQQRLACTTATVVPGARAWHAPWRTVALGRSSKDMSGAANRSGMDVRARAVRWRSGGSALALASHVARVVACRLERAGQGSSTVSTDPHCGTAAGMAAASCAGAGGNHARASWSRPALSTHPRTHPDKDGAVGAALASVGGSGRLGRMVGVGAPICAHDVQAVGCQVGAGDARHQVLQQPLVRRLHAAAAAAAVAACVSTWWWGCSCCCRINAERARTLQQHRVRAHCCKRLDVVSDAAREAQQAQANAPGQRSHAQQAASSGGGVHNLRHGKRTRHISSRWPSAWSAQAATESWPCCRH